MIAKVKYEIKHHNGIISIVCKPTDTQQTILKKAKSTLRRSGFSETDIQSLTIQSRA
ncbi:MULTISPECIES: hypothetical protein [Flammeovirga]|uniref:Uncharacterized protein n=1 Tax=Flammeovirga agarivorans TaxID=2726742 RepID=A0A7X8XW77_9BACT|nr:MULTISPECIES: hypothetical protein [Flammeovirga]NLR91981.1 hypothetical protein [Flammeovirga agarivorans]